MADTSQIISEIILDLDKLRKQAVEAENIGKDSGKKAGKGIGDGLESGLGGAFGRFKKELLGIGALIGGAFALKSMIKEATQAEDALNSFNASLKIAGNFSQAASQRFQEYASSLQRVTTVGDDAIIQGGALLASLGKLQGEGLEKATKAALDLSAGLNIDVNSAFELVSKAATGNTAVLGRYGIRVQATGDAARDFATTLEKVNQTFGGMAESKVNTFSGAVAQLNNNFSDVVQAFGEAIVKSPAMVALIKFASAEMARFASVVTEFTGKGGFNDLVKSLVDFGQSLITWVIAPLELLYNVGRTAFYGLLTLVQAFIVGVADAVNTGAGLLAKFSDKFVGIQAETQTIADSTKSVLNDFKTQTADSASGIFDFNTSTTASNYVARIQEVVAAATPVAVEAGNTIRASIHQGVAGVTFQNVVDAMNDMKSKVQVTAAEIAKTVNSSIVGGLGSAFSAMGGALAKGENAWDAFGKSILKTLGQLLVTFGTMLIAVGVGLSTVPFLFGLSGPAAIAAGVAATILGGALMALGGGGSAGPATSGAGGGGGANEAGPATGFENGFPVIEEQKQQQVFQLHVQGNVLNTRDTALHLLDLMNEVGDGTGARVVTA
jgi:hypothetical protein